MTLATLKKIIKGIPDEDFDDYTLVRDPNNTIIEGLRIDELLKVIYI